MGKTSKVVVCGMKGVGKTSILEQAIYGNVTDRTVIFDLIDKYEFCLYFKYIVLGNLSNNRRYICGQH